MWRITAFVRLHRENCKNWISQRENSIFGEIESLPIKAGFHKVKPRLFLYLLVFRKNSSFCWFPKNLMTKACSKFKLHHFYCAQPKWSVLLVCTIPSSRLRRLRSLAVYRSVLLITCIWRYTCGWEQNVFLTFLHTHVCTWYSCIVHVLKLHAKNVLQTFLGTLWRPQVYAFQVC